ncbi:RNA polymerase sigma factor [Streptomyces lavendofoliae]|uniref:RNA polymerase sigma factor n=1 Tax=Streptomyces lavendofoliae TaxID=67314 RepID=UPI003D8DA7AE
MIFRRQKGHKPLAALDARFRKEYEDRHNQSAVRYVILAMAGPEADIEALTHDTFLRYYKLLLADAADGPARPLLRHIARGIAVDDVRASQRKPWKSLSAFPDNAPWASVSRFLGPELAYEIVEMFGAIGSLSPELRNALLLREYMRVPRDEVAEILGITPDSVTTNVNRAKKRLREAHKERRQLPSMANQMKGGAK